MGCILNIPFLDLGPTYCASRNAIDRALNRVVSSGSFVLGRELACFEAAWAAYCESSHAVGLGNGLDALHLGLRALGVAPEDEVLVPSNTFIATWLAVSQCGARPVPVEPDSSTYNMDPALLEASISPRTRAILPVHLYGQPADMDAIQAVADAYGLLVLDDCAQAHGARYRGRPVGSLARLSAWSFYPGKNLGAFGDAGGITTSESTLADILHLFRNYGSVVKYHNEVRGWNSRLDEIHAAVLAAKLPMLDALIADRRRIASRYLHGLSGTGLVLPSVPEWAEPAWHLFVVRHPARGRFRSELAAMGVQTLIHYPVPPHLQAAYVDLGYKEGDLPIAERIHRDAVSLPLWPGMTDDQIEWVIESVVKAARSTML